VAKGDSVPELPEVETIVRELRPHLVGRCIRRADVLNPTICTFAPDELRGAVVRSVERRGKYTLLYLTRRRNSPVLVFHLGMTGQLLLSPPRRPVDGHTHVVLRFACLSDELRFRDVRRFGEACLYHSPLDLRRGLFDRLGPEGHTVTSKQLARVAWRSSRPIKPLLMDQGKVAGLGNIYTDEALWRARLHPLRPSDSLAADELRELARSIRSVLREAIHDRGSSVDDYLTPDGSPGRYQDRHSVYGRQGRPCHRCGTAVHRIRLQGRGTHFCPRCQPGPGSGGARAD